ncbi:hypothetical protein ACOSP7_012295 [Xanthoceras sorbifolium]
MVFHDELEEEDDIEDFGGLASAKSHADDDDSKNVGLDDDDDDKETVAIDRKRVRRESGLALRKLEKEEPGAKLKKKARVLVEVRVYDHIFSAFVVWGLIFLLVGRSKQTLSRSA